jgi:hypothetical protein
MHHISAYQQVSACMSIKSLRPHLKLAEHWSERVVVSFLCGAVQRNTCRCVAGVDAARGRARLV